MDFLNPKKKRAHQIRLFVGYGLMAVALGIATLILVFAAYGYGIDRTTGDVIQNGLVVVDAHPESATVFANDVNKGTTSTRLILPAGQYAIQLKRDGYRSWSHTVNLEGGSIEQLVYPYLFPATLITKNLTMYNGMPSFTSTSPDRHWLVVPLPDAPGNFQVMDLNNTKNPSTTIGLPVDTLTTPAGPQSFEAVEWSSDNIHLLLKHIFTGGVEFIVLDRDTPSASVNVNKALPGIAFDTISLRDKKPDQFYTYSAATGTLSSIDTRTRAPKVIGEHVASYKSYQADTLLYVMTPAPGAATTEVHFVQGDQDHVLRNIPTGATYLLDMASFNGHFYLGVGSNTDGHTYVYKDPADDYGRHPARTPQPLRVLIVKDAAYISFSAIARFIEVQSGSSFAVYDAETGRQYRYDAKLTVPVSQKATWMDGHRLLLNSQNTTYAFDFDGTNMQKLNAALPAFTPVFDRDFTALFALAPVVNDASKTNLNRTELRVLPPGQTSF